VKTIERLDSAVHVSWMIRADYPAVLAIERACFDEPWTEDELVRCLRARNQIGMVARHGERILGYMVYAAMQKELRVLNFAVHAEFRRRGVGRAMADKLRAKLSPSRRPRLKLKVRETNLDAQLFWRAMGYRAVKIIRNPWPDLDEHQYLFRYALPKMQTAGQ